MSLDKELYEKIDSYLKGNLPDHEMQWFEEQILQNVELAKEVENARKMHQLVIKHRLLKVKEMARREEIRMSERDGNLRRFGFGGGLFLMVILLTTTFFYFSNKDAKPDIVGNERISPVSLAVKTDTVDDPEKKEMHETSFPENITESEKQDLTQALKGEIIVDEVQAAENTDKIQMDTLMKSGEEEKTDLVEPVGGTEEIKTFTSEKPSNTDPCHEVSLDIRYEVVQPCSGKKEGAISVSKIIGGTSPYQQDLYDGKGIPVVPEQLHAGNYQLRVKDSEGCEEYFPIKIAEKNCTIDAYFNPSYNEVWKVPVSEKEGKLFIYNKTGGLVFQAQLEANVAFEWNGTNTDGRIVPGYYIFVIEYKDGTIEKGSVTITL